MLLASLNRKLGKNCFTVGAAQATEVQVLFDGACASADSLKRLETLPPEGLLDSPAGRIQEVVTDPSKLHRTTTI
jgi:hypothetical protein